MSIKLPDKKFQLEIVHFNKNHESTWNYYCSLVLEKNIIEKYFNNKCSEGCNFPRIINIFIYKKQLTKKEKPSYETEVYYNTKMSYSKCNLKSWEECLEYLNFEFLDPEFKYLETLKNNPMNYKNLLNPPVQEAQIVWSFKKFYDPAHFMLKGKSPRSFFIKLFSHIWDELEELEPNPAFWFASEEDCQIFLKNADLKEIQELQNKETYYK